MSRLCSFSLALVAFTATTAAYSAETAPASTPTVGLIDMAHVFKNYRKFSNMTAALQEEIEQIDQEARGKVEQIKQLQGQLLGGSLTEGSDEYSRIEAQLVKTQADLESFKRASQREFLRREADIYKTVYLEVEDAVSRYARHYHYSVVLRFSRQNVDDAENPRDIINGMNRQVLYHQPEDDITDPVLTHLNEQWDKQVGNPAPAAAQPASRSTR